MGFEWCFSGRVRVRQGVRKRDVRVFARYWLPEMATTDAAMGTVGPPRHTSPESCVRSGRFEAARDEGLRHDVSGKNRG